MACMELKAQLAVEKKSLADIKKKLLINLRVNSWMPKSGQSNFKKNVTDTKFWMKIKRYKA